MTFSVIEIVSLGALLHDIALINRVGDRKDHHINGEIIAKIFGDGRHWEIDTQKHLSDVAKAFGMTNWMPKRECRQIHRGQKRRNKNGTVQ